MNAHDTLATLDAFNTMVRKLEAAAFNVGDTIRIARDEYTGHARIIRVGRSGNWATVATMEGGTMVVGRRHVLPALGVGDRVVIGMGSLTGQSGVIVDADAINDQFRVDCERCGTFGVYHSSELSADADDADTIGEAYLACEEVSEPIEF